MKPEIKKIVVAYWYSDHEEKTGIKHLSEYEYSTRKFNSLIHKIIDSGLNVQTITGSTAISIYIDDKRFSQR